VAWLKLVGSVARYHLADTSAFLNPLSTSN
jgi:hypothetical protein